MFVRERKMYPILKIANQDVMSTRPQLEGIGSGKGRHSKQGFFAGVRSKAMKQRGLS